MWVVKHSGLLSVFPMLACHCLESVSYVCARGLVFDVPKRLSALRNRGEALSSLCALAESVTICTRTADESCGMLLTYDRNGKLVKQVIGRNALCFCAWIFVVVTELMYAKLSAPRAHTT